MARSAEVNGVVAVMCDDRSVDLHDGDTVRTIFPADVEVIFALHDVVRGDSVA